MVIEICLAIIAVTLMGFVVVLIRISSQMRKSIRLLQTELNGLSVEVLRLLSSLNEFIQADLHPIAQQTTQLVSQLNDLSSNISRKAHSLDFIFKPLIFMNGKLGWGSCASQSHSKSEAIPLAIKWIVSSAFLFKKTREYLKNHEK